MMRRFGPTLHCVFRFGFRFFPFTRKQARRFTSRFARRVRESVGCGQRDSAGHVALMTPPAKPLHHRFGGRKSVVPSGRRFFILCAGRRCSGDVSLARGYQLPLHARRRKARIAKALLMFRQCARSRCDVRRCGHPRQRRDTALQYRRTRGDTTQDIAFNSGAPKTLRPSKSEATPSRFLSAITREPLHQAGASIKLHFDEPFFYAGIGGVCRAQQGRGGARRLRQRRTEAACTARLNREARPVQHPADDRDRQQRAHGDGGVYRAQPHRGAPNWTRDGKSLIFARDGKLSDDSRGGRRERNRSRWAT